MVENNLRILILMEYLNLFRYIYSSESSILFIIFDKSTVKVFKICVYCLTMCVMISIFN